MNRRNFILGLGTAATLSGAASVTGATIQNEVTPNANFQVVAEDRLEIEKNGELSDATMESNGNYSSFLNYDDNSSSDFNPTAADDGGDTFPNMTIDNGTNDNLEMALATDTNNVSYNRNGSASAAGGPYPSSTPYDPSDGEGIAPLQIVNPGGQVTISAQFQRGSNVDSQTDNELLAQVFSFYVEDVADGNAVTEISPDVSDVDGDNSTITTTNTADIDGGTNEVYFTLNMNDQLATDLADIASTSNSLEFGSASQTAVDLLDTVEFGRDG